LADAPIGTLQQALRNLESACARYRRGQAQFPTFKKKGRSDSFRYSHPSEIKLDQVNNRILLPSLGWLRYRSSRDVLGRVRNVTVSSSGVEWFVSMLTERQVERPIALRAQRSLSRKTKYGRNWRKEKARVQRIYLRIANARADYLHKISSTISQNHAVVFVEDLRVSAMSQSDSAPGKRRLNKSILDQGWFEFRRQLDYKLRWNGGRLIAVSPRNTSITCPHCRHIGKENRLSQAQFECVACGLQENADLVGNFACS
jgi:putative transposase